jgi:dipeptidyl aminopeptidase/acylaminoacyl peptidase
MKRSLSLLISVFFLYPASAGFSASDEQEKTPTFQDILNLKSPGSPVISPDGRFVLYTVREADWEKNEYRSQIWLANVETGETRQLTFHEKSSGGPAWSPDGKYISFTSAREEKSQVHIMPVDGGEPRAVTKSETGVGSYAWSPDGKWIAYTASDDQSKRQKAVEKKYGKFEVFEEEFDIQHLRLCEVESGKTEKLVDREDLHVTGFNWSPDGAKIAFSANPDSLIKSFSNSDIYLVSVADKAIHPLVQQPGPDSDPVWSSCGEWIAFSSGMGSDSYFKNNEICVIKVDGDEVIPLTREFDEDKSLLDWKEDGIYFTAFQGMTSHLFRIDKDRQIMRISSGDSIFRGFSLSKDGARMAFFYTDGSRYPEVYYSATAAFEPRKLTDFSAQLQGWKLSTKETIKWTSSDGAEITGVLIKPADFDPAKKYPLLVIIHGGPSSISYPALIDGYMRYYPIEQWCAKGALILEPNYRGSTGFGEAFRSLNYRNLGVGDYWDVISGVDYLVSQGFVDNEKLGAMGWSQGGYISAFITTYSDRFKAVSVGAGISDWVTYYYKTDITPFCPQYLGATPWADPEVYKLTSPMTHINNAKTPTLIQHGENDARVPITNAHKLYRGLKDLGVAVKFVIYKGFGHGISKPKENLAVLTHNWHWFNKYIWGEEPEEEKFEEEEKAEEKKP